MKEKIRKLFRGTYEDRLIACNLLFNNYDINRFLRKWEKEDSTIFPFVADDNTNRAGVQFIPTEDIEGGAKEGDFYYHYSPRRWLLCTHEEIVVCHNVYHPGIQTIEHEREN